MLGNNAFISIPKQSQESGSGCIGFASLFRLSRYKKFWIFSRKVPYLKGLRWSKKINPFIPLLLLLFLILVLYFTNIHEEFSLDTLHQKGAAIQTYVKNHPVLSPFLFIGIYVLSVCLIIPDSSLLTLLAGFVFPFPLALIYSLFSETTGAFLFFILFQRAFKNSKYLLFHKMEKAFQAYPASYLLFLRFSHLIPFWLTTIGAAYFKVRFRTFLWTTVVGILPLSVVLVEGGHHLSKTFATNVPLSLEDIFSLQIKMGLLLLGVLSLSPILVKKILHRKKWGGSL